MKKSIFILLLLVFVAPSVAFASWWNPFSWFNGWTFHEEISSEIVQPQSPPLIDEPNSPSTSSIPAGELKKEPSDSQESTAPLLSPKSEIPPTPSSPKTPTRTCKIDSFSASPNPVIDTAVVKPMTKLSWETKNCDVVYMTGTYGPTLTELAKSGSVSVNVPQTVTYTLHASTIYNENTGNTGVDERAITVTVKPVSVSSSICQINSFSASPNPVTDLAYIKPETALSWSTENCDVVYLSGGAAPLGTISKSGSLTINTPQTTTFTLHASTIYMGSSGNAGVDEKSLTVTVNPATSSKNCMIDNFTASPNPVRDLAYIKPETTLSWQTSNCDVVYLSGGAAPLGTLDKTGSLNINTPQTTTFTLHASTIYNGTSGNTGVDDKDLTVTVIAGN
jgi:cytoskeletal protein RodZ